MIIHQGDCASVPEAGARCGSSARRDLCGGCRATGIPTATTRSVAVENLAGSLLSVTSLHRTKSKEALRIRQHVERSLYPTRKDCVMSIIIRL